MTHVHELDCGMRFNPADPLGSARVMIKASKYGSQFRNSPVIQYLDALVKIAEHTIEDVVLKEVFDLMVDDNGTCGLCGADAGEHLKHAPGLHEPWCPFRKHEALFATVRGFSSTTAKVALEVVAERFRQIREEGWTAKHDNQHRGGALSQAAACYTLHAIIAADSEECARWSPPIMEQIGLLIGRLWPWAEEWWKPKSRRRNGRAAALIMAEIDRIDRMAEVEGAAR